MRSPKSNAALTVAIIAAMLVVAAAFAIPAWQNHTTRKHVARAMEATDAAKLVVLEAATMRGGLSKVTLADLAHNTQRNNPYVANLAMDDGGRITLTTRDTGADPDPVLVLIPSEKGDGSAPDAITWSCTMIVGPEPVIPKTCDSTADTSSHPTPARSAKADAGDANS